MIDVFVIHYKHCQRPTFAPRQSIYRGGPSLERIREIEREFPIIGNWIYRILPNGSYRKWQFCGRHRY